MKKAAAFVTALCFMILAVSPVSVKAAGSDIYIISKVGNGSSNTDIYNTSFAQNYYPYMANDWEVGNFQTIISSFDVPEGNKIIVIRNGGGNPDNPNDITTYYDHLKIYTFPSDKLSFFYDGNYHQGDLLNQGSSVTEGSWVWGPQFTIYINSDSSGAKPSDCNCYEYTSNGWTLEAWDASWSSYWHCFNGSGVLVYTDCGHMLNGSEIAYHMYHDNVGIAEAVQSCENWLPKFQVTNDGQNTVDYDDAFGNGSGYEDFSLNEGFGFSQFECLTMYDGSRDPELSLRSSWALNVNTMDFDSIDLSGATYGIHYDAVLNYRVTESADRKVYQPILGGAYSGTIYSSWDSEDMNINELKSGSVTIPLRTIFGSDTAEAVGTTGGAGAVILIDTALNNGRSSVFGNPSFLGTDLVSVYEAAVDYAGALGYSVQAIAGVIVPTTTYYLDSLNIQLSATPYIKTKGQKGVLSQRTVDYLTGASGGFTTDLKYPDPSDNSNQITIAGVNYPTEYKYTTPSYDANGNMNYIIVDGSPSNAYGGNGGSGGNATANNYVQFESGIKGLTDRFLEEEAGWNRSWWSVFGVFEENPASELYTTYFSWLPPEFLQFILDIAAVVFLVGAARFIRRG